jgi:transposase InsO family protein
MEFVTLARHGDANRAALCRRFGVSRKTGYKWLARFDAAGEAGLVDGSRRPRGSPARTDGGGARCWPLTVLDDHSRYVVGLEACIDEKETTVRERLTRIFERHGLPDAIITDNGAPWGHANGVTRYTRFSVWLLRLGIRPLHCRPCHPQTMGKIERMHRSLKAECLQGRRFPTVDAVQPGLDRWRAHYNHHRPHDALGGATPASRYRMSKRSMPARLIEPDYGDDDVVRRVRANGCLRCRPTGQRRVDLQLAAAFADQTVAVRPSAEDGVHHVCFMTWRIATVDFRTNPNRPSVTHLLEHL